MTRIKTLLMAAVIFAAFVLGGCGAASPMDTAEEIKTELGGYSSLTLTASITASYENCVYNFKIKCVSGDAGLELEILEPESLAGIRAKLEEEGFTLSYDGVEMSTGKLTEEGLSPAGALPVLIEQWTEGYASGAVYETYGGVETLALDTNISDTVKQRTWFDRETHLPVHSEISENGTVVVTCDFENIVTS